VTYVVIYDTQDGTKTSNHTRNLILEP
jgi:hypothetical protein